MAFFRPRLNPRAVFAGAFGGMLTLLLFLDIPLLPPGVWNPPFGGIFSWPWNPLIAMTATLLISEALSAVMGARRTRPTEVV